MEYRDRVIKCMECGSEFVFTAGESSSFTPTRGLRTSPSGARTARLRKANHRVAKVTSVR